MKKAKKDIVPLDFEILVIQLKNILNEVDVATKKQAKKDRKHMLTVLLPSFIALACIVLIPSKITYIICLSVILGTFVIDQFIESINSLKRYKNEKNEDNIIIFDFDEEKDVLQVLEKGVDKGKGEDFYNKTFKDAVENSRNEKKTEVRHSNVDLKIIWGKEKFLNKDETMVQIVKEFDAYFKIYNLPPLKINSKDWDCFFDVLYDFFTNKGIENNFYEVMSRICRLTLADVLVNKDRVIKINDFIDKLDYLIPGDFNCGIIINKNEIVSIQKEILSKIHSSNIIYIKNRIKTRKREK